MLCYSSTSTVYSPPTYNFARAGFPLNSASIVRFEILQFSQPTHSPAKPSPSWKARAADAAPALETSHPVSVSVPNSSTLGNSPAVDNRRRRLPRPLLRDALPDGGVLAPAWAHVYLPRTPDLDASVLQHHLARASINARDHAKEMR